MSPFWRARRRIITPTLPVRLIDFATNLVYVATYMVIIPILVAIYFYRFQSKALKILLGGLVIVLFLDVLLLFFNAKNTFLYIFSAVDALSMALIFSVAITNERVSTVSWKAGVLFVLLIGFDAFFWSGITTNGYSNALEKVFVLGLTLYYLTQLLQDEEVVTLAEQPLFWVCVGVLMYNLVGLFDIFSKPMLSFSRNLYLQFYVIWSFVTICMYGCFAFAFWQSKHNTEV